MGRKIAPQKWAATKTIVNAISTAGWATSAVNIAGTDAAKTVASGSLTANTLAAVLSISGPGVMPILAATTADATARTIRIQVIVDGSTPFDYTSASVAATSRGGVVAGNMSSNGASQVLIDGEPIRWNSSLVVKIASSLTETDKINVHYRYHLT